MAQCQHNKIRYKYLFDNNISAERQMCNAINVMRRDDNK